MNPVGKLQATVYIVKTIDRCFPGRIDNIISTVKKYRKLPLWFLKIGYYIARKVNNE